MQLFTPSTVSKVVVSSHPAAILHELFKSFELPVTIFSFQSHEKTVRRIDVTTNHVEPKKYSIYKGLWNISPKDSNAC